MKIGMLGCGKIGKTLLKEICDHEYGEVIFVQDPAAEESVVSACAPGAKLIREPEDDWQVWEGTIRSIRFCMRDRPVRPAACIHAMSMSMRL